MTDLERHLETLVAAIVERKLAARNDERAGYLTVAAYAEKWSISQSTVRQAIADGRLAADHVGRAVRILATARIAPRRRRSAADRARLRLLGGAK